jgi:hypothetical protein
LTDIPDHLWFSFRCELEQNPHRAEQIVRSFCKIADIPREAVMARLRAEQELAEERAGATVH